MNKRISKRMEQSSVELSLNNGIMNSQPNWSRCNSFSSSSSDSTLYCSNSPQRSSFPGRKRQKTDDPVAKIMKRSRNSSGSSASSNLSCLSDKEVNGMPTLISSEQVNNIETLSDISPSTLALQHEVLLNSRLSHPLDSVLPFRHNLRRNIRKKTCSCDCTATCTTVVVSRQYKGIGEKTVEEKTVISHTKVKTYVENSVDEKPVRQVQVSSKLSFQENMAHKNDYSFKKEIANKNEGNRKRRSEIEKLYDSLHEITWAKNFSPDNILRQFDVRQAASCSAFGKSSEVKSPANKSHKANKCFKSGDMKSPNKSVRDNNSYATRSSLRNSRNKEDNSIPPVLEKSIISLDEALDIDSPHYNTYPVLSKEVVTPEKDNNATVSVDFSSSCNAIETDCSTLNNLKTKLSIDINPHCNIDSQITNLTGCSSTFFDITEDNIHTIDACFREVGAEVIVSTCCDTDFNNLPLLTAVKEIHSSNFRSISDDCPPVLEQCESTFDSSSDNSIKNNSNTSDEECDQSVEFSKKFFPAVNPQLILDEEYSPLSFLEVIGKEEKNTDKINLAAGNDKNFENEYRINYEDDISVIGDNIDDCLVDSDKINYASKVEDKINNSLDQNERNYVEENCDESNCVTPNICDNDKMLIVDDNPNLPNLMSGDEIKILNQNVSFEPGPPILEPFVSNEVCLTNIESGILISESIMNKATDSHKETNNSASDMCDKSNCRISRTKHYSKKSKNIRQICRSIKSFKSKSYIISSSRSILKKYIKFINSKSKRQKKLTFFHRPSKSSVVSCKTSSDSNIFCNMKSLMNCNLSSGIPLSLTNCAQMPSSIQIKNSSAFSQSSPSQITKGCMPTLQIINKCISTSESCLQSTSTITNAKSSTVIQSFNQKLSFSTSEENITLDQIQGSSMLIPTEKKPSLNNRKAKKPSLNNILNNHCVENFADIPGYAKILIAAKKKGHSEEKIQVPPRTFTCHYQTINVTRGNDYIQIVLKITRGKSIFLTHETLIELKEAIIKAGNDKDCRLLILNGFGQTFCLGLDLRPLVGDHKDQVVGKMANAVKELIGTLADFQKPLVAIVNGAAYGLGLTILNHADITLATSNASFCMPYSRLGYMPEGGATLTLPQAVGTTVAMDLILRGQVITAEQARDIGLVNEVVEVRHLPQDLVSRVQKIAENSLPGMEATKAMIKMRLHIQLPLVLETEAKLLPQMWLSPSCQEAIQSALDSGFFEDC